MGEKLRNTKANKTKGKNSQFGCPLFFSDMEADCFPVSENTENNADLPKVGGVPNLMEQKKKTGSGAVRTGCMNLYKWDSKIFRKSGLE